MINPGLKISSQQMEATPYDPQLAQVILPWLHGQSWSFQEK
jgi:hypothetical protein